MTSPPLSVAVALKLQGYLSKEAQVLTDPESAAFKTSMSRWTDVNKQTPAAILQPACETDVERIVRSPLLPFPSFLPSFRPSSLSL